MKAEMKRGWVQALRSGKYKQGRGYLHQVTAEGEHHYCCMGVLCEIEGITREEMSIYTDRKESSENWPLYVKRFNYEFHYAPDKNDVEGIAISMAQPMGDLSNEIERGLPEKDMDFHTRIDTLIDLNDSKSYSFPEIANWIEEHVPED